MPGFYIRSRGAYGVAEEPPVCRYPCVLAGASVGYPVGLGRESGAVVGG